MADEKTEGIKTNSNAIRLYYIKAKIFDDGPVRANEVFIGLFIDESYHVLGCRPEGMGYLLSDDRQSQED